MRDGGVWEYGATCFMPSLTAQIALHVFTPGHGLPAVLLTRHLLGAPHKGLHLNSPALPLSRTRSMLGPLPPRRPWTARTSAWWR